MSLTVTSHETSEKGMEKRNSENITKFYCNFQDLDNFILETKNLKKSNLNHKKKSIELVIIFKLISFSYQIDINTCLKQF